MNPAMGFFERHFVRWWRPKTPSHFRQIRVLAIIIVYVCLFSTIFLVAKFVIPEIFNNFLELSNNIPEYMRATQEVILDLEQTLT